MELPGASLRDEQSSIATSALVPLLRVRDLTVSFSVDATHRICPLRGITFQIRIGEAIGILGESGAGKTTLALALLRLLPPSGRVIRGSIEIAGRQLLSVDRRELRTIRGTKIALVSQDSSGLNPVLRVGEHLVEVLRAHYDWPRRRYREKAMSLLGDVELADVDRIYAAYPHQLSGGQRQRIVIAQALACQPALVIADEPTASLDAETSREILELLGRFKRRFQTAFLLISHDLAPLATLADRIMVMYAGRIVEQGLREEILQRPQHPYTRALLVCALPGSITNDSWTGKRAAPTIAGSPPDLMHIVPGCDFENRCEDRMSICRTQVPAEVEESPTRSLRCFKFGGRPDAHIADV